MSNSGQSTILYMRITHGSVRVMQQSAPVLLPIFRSRLQGDVLARTLGEPEGVFTVVELARAGGVDASTVTRELTRLVGAGLLNEERVGRTRVVRANPASTPHHHHHHHRRRRRRSPARAHMTSTGAVTTSGAKVTSSPSALGLPAAEAARFLGCRRAGRRGCACRHRGEVGEAVEVLAVDDA